jgi:hypothetical protein
VVFDPSNVVNPEYWFDKPLIYTFHAEERCIERKIKRLEYLPITSKLIDCDKYPNGVVKAMTFKVNDVGDCFVLASDGSVITVFSCKDKNYDKYVYRKNEYRYHVNRLNTYFGNSSHRLIPRKYARM